MTEFPNALLSKVSKATSTDLGFERGTLVFAGLVALVAAAFFLTRIPRSTLF